MLPRTPTAQGFQLWVGEGNRERRRRVGRARLDEHGAGAAAAVWADGAVYKEAHGSYTREFNTLIPNTFPTRSFPTPRSQRSTLYLDSSSPRSTFPKEPIRSPRLPTNLPPRVWRNTQSPQNKHPRFAASMRAEAQAPELHSTWNAASRGAAAAAASLRLRSGETSGARASGSPPQKKHPWFAWCAPLEVGPHILSSS